MNDAIILEHVRPKIKDIFRIVLDITGVELYQKYSWRIIKCGGLFYLARHSDNKTVLFHRELKGLTHKDIDVVVDHINGNSLDNRQNNLRICSRSENNRNKVNLKYTSGCYFNKSKNKWQAQIKIDGIATYLGRFDTKKEAEEAYIKKCLELGYISSTKERFDDMKKQKEESKPKEKEVV